MISVIVYGRNDAHGYNLHRRAALSLNCIAEVLTHPDDELVFVDYNTPDELPTFIEAISDTLTERCIELLRVLRVPAAIHEQRFAANTHLPVVEPVARNVAARRANPSNRWLLSTNTDMIFIPLQEQSLSEICSDLLDGFYTLPRFELPEWLWERLPRSEPRRAAAEIERLGPALRLDEPTVSHEWIRFDAPGDFELILHEDFTAIDGFDEAMLRGYHVDSNLSRRLLLHRGTIESLEEHLAGYHCNHNRTRTVYHGAHVENDLDRFFFSVEAPELRDQRAAWGLAGVTLEEVPIRERVSTRCATTLVDAIPTGPRTPSDAFGAPFALTYDSGHVLPFVADTLVVSPPATTIGYLGANTVLKQMLATLVEALGFERPLAVASLDDATAIDEVAGVTDVVVFDLGIDKSQVTPALGEVSRSDLPHFPSVLDHAPTALNQLIDNERRRLDEGRHPRRIVLVNSSAAFWDAYVVAQFDCSYTTIHSRVRRATVKPVPDQSAAARSLRLMRWVTRRSAGSGRAPILPSSSVEIADLDDYRAFGRGWTHPEDFGIWTQGPRSELTIAIDRTDAKEYVFTLSVGMICVGSDESLSVEVLANGKRVAARDFRQESAGPWRVDLTPDDLRECVDLTVLIDEPCSPLALGWSDDERRLGLLLNAVTLQEIDRSVRPGDAILFHEGSGAERLLGDGWWTLEPTGVWTVDERARLLLDLVDIAKTEVELDLDVAAFVTAEHPELEVQVSARGEQLAERIFRYGEAERSFRVRLPGVMINGSGRAVLDFRLRDPERPVDLGLGDDSRRLGLYLRTLTVREPAASRTRNASSDRARRFRKRSMRPFRR